MNINNPLNVLPIKRALYVLILLLLVVGCGHNSEPKNTPKNVKSVQQPTIVHYDSIQFLGYRVALNDSVNEQLISLAEDTKAFSIKGRVISLFGVDWGLNIEKDGINLLTSTPYTSPKIQKVIDGLTNIYGKPYDNDIDDAHCYWYEVRMRSLRMGEEGTVMFFE